jgi:hypothetical protein
MTNEIEFQVLIKMTPHNNETAIGSSSGDAWMDMAVVLEGLGVICKKCIENGMDEKEVYGEVYKYFAKLSKSYKILHDEN